MARNKRNILKYHSWQLLISQISIFVLLAFIFKQSGIPRYTLLSLAIYMLLSGYLKVIIPKWHRKGLFYIRKGEYEGAIYALEKSYSFFAKHAWVDRYRAFTLFSISKLSYREMALMNIIYCYEKLGENDHARKVQQKLKVEFPLNPYGHKK